MGNHPAHDDHSPAANAWRAAQAATVHADAAHAEWAATPNPARRRVARKASADAYAAWVAAWAAAQAERE
jgi:hypothetical protein